jgi:hypothetical protein
MKYLIGKIICEFKGHDWQKLATIDRTKEIWVCPRCGYSMAMIKPGFNYGRYRDGKR